ncbi:putative diguanylate cyclase (GGDEF) [Bradyrhizobium sp. ORS 285]|uniref:GGDEF domain-containing protein n=1 Tax=Bradyrhizobium sp. ORS 285 TaxID=115808 RepID=UPI0002FF4A55|nr:GGDEF domain-containing protein [Bradyrhizobium sp. ORS 285]SMX56018.1 putative diguanylate cyclase (GGDEF) [Bradyrhizobium sp. ORS 285]
MKKKRIKKVGPAAKRGPRYRRKASSRARGPGTATAPAGARQTIRRLKAELAAAEARIAELTATAERDFLLDIFNRRGFARELHRSIAFIKRYDATGALVVLDVDRLKPINDTFGHAAGDEVLKAVARVLGEQVRSSDVIGRLGGDEFGVLLWHLSETDARAKAAALEEAIDGLSFTFGDQTVRAGASAGVALLDKRVNPVRALEEADRAMYVRKAQRRHDVRA